MKLSPGITDITPEWEILLRQIGLPVEKTGPDEPPDPAEMPVLIVSGPRPAGASRERIRDYVQAGGAALIEADLAKTILGTATRRRFIKYLNPADEALFAGAGLCDLTPVRRRVAEGAEYLPDQSGLKTLAVAQIGKGIALIAPSGFCAALRSYQSRRKNFPGLPGERFPSERVSRVAKGSIRRIIQKALKYIYHYRGLPFLHLWPIPGGAATAFGFRVDTDFGSREAVKELYHVCRDYEIPAAWFVETQSAAGWIDEYAGMQGQEIGYHCYRHRVFPDYRGNRADIEKGLGILRSVGIRPQGYAAPFGEWHPALGKAIQDLGFQYSSEFAAGYDDLPFYPWPGERFPSEEGAFSTVLQVPIHPVSIGRLRLAGYREPEKMAEYYRQVIIEKIIQQDPVFFYHHPGHRHFEVIARVFKEIRERNIPVLSPGEYARWWKKRGALHWEAHFENGQLNFASNGDNESVWVCAAFPGGEIYLAPIAAKTLDKARRPDTPEEVSLLQRDARLLRQYHWRMLAGDILWAYGKWKR